MGRPVTISDEVILKAARDCFLEQGIRATTADIARRAGVSPGIIFKRFVSKEALFKAAMSADFDPEEMLPIDLEAQVGKGNVCETLIGLGEQMLDKFMAVVPLAMMEWANTQTSDTHGRSGRAAEGFMSTRRGERGQRRLIAYLEAEARLGRIRRADFVAFAAMFGGMLWNYASVYTIFGQAQRLQPPREGYVRRMMETLWYGLAPDTKQKKR